MLGLDIHVHIVYYIDFTMVNISSLIVERIVVQKSINNIDGWTRHNIEFWMRPAQIHENISFCSGNLSISTSPQIKRDTMSNKLRRGENLEPSLGEFYSAFLHDITLPPRSFKKLFRNGYERELRLMHLCLWPYHVSIWLSFKKLYAQW